jgi:hypothetical protein
MWQETTLLNNISSGLYKVGSPLNALAAETFKTGFLQMRWYDFTELFRGWTFFVFIGKPINFALNKCLNPIAFILFQKKNTNKDFHLRSDY